MIWSCLLLAAFGYFAFKRMLTYIHIFQQEEYDGIRFFKWILRHYVVDITASALVVTTGVIFLLSEARSAFSFCAYALILLCVALREKDPRVKAKKKLALTDRVKRILSIAYVAAISLGAYITFAYYSLWGVLALIHVLPLLLIVSNMLLVPLESRIQRRFWLEASTRLKQLSPYVVGITGSYGKTSVKHILGHVLNCFSPTLITPGSINTAMGISRVIRTKLEDKHKYFIVEMGAYGIGSIARLCKLCQPQLAIITNIGSAHLERFQTLETVAIAKYELADCVLQAGGNVVSQEDVLQFHPFSTLEQHHHGSTVICGFHVGGILLKSVTQTLKGLAMELQHGETHHSIVVPLFGYHHAMNAALAFGAACSLGFNPADVVNALRSVPQISHRLEVKQLHEGVVLIDDAYNSNPVGFRSAVALLNDLADGKGRRILVTPGLVELGISHVQEHARLGTLSASCVDVLVAVCPRRIPSFVNAFQQSASPESHVVLCETFKDAEQWIAENTRSGDVVLLENDLPDLYETRLLL